MSSTSRRIALPPSKQGPASNSTLTSKQTLSSNSHPPKRDSVNGSSTRDIRRFFLPARAPLPSSNDKKEVDERTGCGYGTGSAKSVSGDQKSWIRANGGGRAVVSVGTEGDGREGEGSDGDGVVERGAIKTPHVTGSMAQKRSTSPQREASMESDEKKNIGSSTPQRRLVTVCRPSPHSRDGNSFSDTYAASTTTATKPDLGAAAVSRATLTASFSSTSTLSSVPLSSQSSSRRVVDQFGWQAVTNSDSGSGDSEDDGLMDMAAFTAPKRRKLSPPTEELPLSRDLDETPRPRSTTEPQTRQSARLSRVRHNAAAATHSHRSPSPTVRPVYKFSLANLARRAQQQENSKTKIAEAEAAFEAAQRKREELVAFQNRDLADGLKIAAADDSDDGERMLLAMERTEAMQSEERFHFFRRGRSVFEAEELDQESMPLAWMRDPLKWRMACLSGFVAQIAAQEKCEVSERLCRWMMAQLFAHNTPDELCEAYVEILRICIARGCWCGLDGLETCYETFPVDIDSQEENASRDAAAVALRSSLPHGLAHVLRILRWSSAHWNTLETARAIVELALLNVDEDIKTNIHLRLTIHDTIEHLLAYKPAEGGLEGLYLDIHNRFFRHPGLSIELRCRTVAALPACTEASHSLRRWLALHLSAERQLSGIVSQRDLLPLQSPEWHDAIMTHIHQSSHFAISESTNYHLLTNLTCVLDLAIGAGFGEPPPPIPSSTTTPPPLPSIPMDTSLKTQHRIFNTRIDALALQLRTLASRIRDAGTSHLRRTQAKSALERVAVRLEHGVRTRPKMKKGVFGGGGNGFAVAASRSALEGFVRRGLGALRGDGDGDEGVVGVEGYEREITELAA